METIAAKQNTEGRVKKKKKNEDSLRDCWDNIKGSNIIIMGSQKKSETKDLRKHLKRK